MILSADDRQANEIYAAEALSRYIAEMFYVLTSIFCLMLATVILRYIAFGEVMIALVVILLAYFAAIVGILANFRFIRLKEVQELCPETKTLYSNMSRRRADVELQETTIWCGEPLSIAAGHHLCEFSLFG